MALEIEIARYNELLPQLLETSEGKIAVIKGQEFLGAFETMDEAYQALLPKYGFVQCLMRTIRAQQPVYDLTNLHLGLIRVQE
ncbi:hypothetical protein SAMN05421819_3377 [Bryocella elongata]|uniref:Uncharacterized protein n=1 Tax=Bryocella elongata TaxID=863522 RepID=A0A1H6AYQ8_9BACT|nr:hypothetical protein [Bryocella elongata]SEG53738.1 hypothetical protein SAMN05421819_3377 [Bryocella elongata]